MATAMLEGQASAVPFILPSVFAVKSHILGWVGRGSNHFSPQHSEGTEIIFEFEASLMAI